MLLMVAGPCQCHHRHCILALASQAAGDVEDHAVAGESVTLHTIRRVSSVAMHACTLRVVRLARVHALFASILLQVMGFIIGSLFWQIDSNAFVLFISLAFFGSTFLAYSNMAEVPVVFVSKQIVHRHLAAGMYPSWSYSISAMLSTFPITFVAVSKAAPLITCSAAAQWAVHCLPAPPLVLQDLIFCTLLYWIVGYANDAGRYFFWCFCGLAMDLCMSSMFRFYAIAAPTQEFAGVLAGAGTGLELVYGGEAGRRGCPSCARLHDDELLALNPT